MSTTALDKRYKRYSIAEGTDDSPTVPVRYITNEENPKWIGHILMETDKTLAEEAENLRLASMYKYTPEDIVMSYYYASLYVDIDDSAVIEKINEYMVELGMDKRKYKNLSGDLAQWKTIYMDMRNVINSDSDSGSGSDVEPDTEYYSYRDENAKKIIGYLLGYEDGNKVPQVRMSDFVYKTTTVYLSVDGDIDSTMGYELFDMIDVSEEIPNIAYKSSKIFNKVISDSLGKDYSVITYPIGNIKEKDVIYMVVWTGTGNIGDASKREFSHAKFNLSEREIEVNVVLSPNGGEINIVIERLSNAIGANIELDRYGRTSGTFNMYGIEEEGVFDNIMYIEELFLEFIAIDTNGLIFLDESNTSYPNRVRRNMSYRELELPENRLINEGYIRNPSSVSFAIQREVAGRYDNLKDEEGNDLVINYGGISRNIKAGTRYVSVNITHASNIDTIEEFVELLTRLMTIYVESWEEIGNKYRNYTPSIFPDTTKTKGIEKFSKVERLKELYPEVFRIGYARICQGPSKQPETISNKTWEYIYNLVRESVEYHNDTIGEDSIPEEDAMVRLVDILRRDYPDDQLDIEAFPEKMTEESLELALSVYIDGRQTMPFPKGEKKFDVLCVDDQNRYPSIILNKKGDNIDEYPYLPCCAMDDQTPKYAKNLYNEYYHGIESKRKIGNKTTINYSKSLPYDRVGTMHSSMERALLNIDSGNLAFYYRKGVVNSINSFLHCILTIYGEDSYHDAKTEEVKEEIAMEYRRRIADFTYPALYKQELFDMSDDSIIDKLTDPDYFYDPILFYRGVEEYFGVNIFILDYDSSKDPSNRETITLPRFKVFHSSPHRDRPSVIILRHWGSSSERRQYPQCELIARNTPEEDTAVFDEPFGGSLHDMLYMSNLSITWSVEKSREVPRANWHSLVDYAKLIGDVIYQYIDSYGKVRAFVFEEDNSNITMIVPPTQPINVEQIYELPDGDGKVVVKTFKQRPTAIDKDKNGDIIGIWYRVADMEHCVYFPIISTRSISTDIDNLPIGPSSPIPQNTISYSKLNISSRVEMVRKAASVTVQLCVWLYAISIKNGESFDGDVFVIMDKPPEESLVVYDVTSIPGVLPDVSKLTDAAKYIKRFMPNFVLSTNPLRLAMMSEKMRDGVLFALNRYYSTRDMGKTSIPDKLHGIYTYASDFKSKPGQIIIAGKRQMKEWLSSKMQPNTRTRILSKLTTSMIYMTKPYLYRDPEGRIFMIQNVAISETSNIQRAINVAYTWLLNRINIGFDASSTSVEFPYAVFGILKGGDLVPIEDRTEGGEEFLMLLMYSSTTYAAMLRLL